MRLGLLSILMLLSLGLRAEEIGSGQGDPKTGKPSGSCADKKNLTIINFRSKAEKPEDAKDDLQMVKRDDGWHLNDFEGEDISFDKTGKPCITAGKNKPVCGDAIKNVNSWRDTDGVKRSHHVKIEYNPENALTITFLDQNGQPDKTMPQAHVDGSAMVKDKAPNGATSNGAASVDAQNGSLNVEFFSPDGKKPEMQGWMRAESSSDGKTPTASNSYITPNKILSTPQKGGASNNDNTVLPDPKSVCEAQGISGWTANVNAANEFSKSRNAQSGDSATGPAQGGTDYWGPAHENEDPSAAQ